MASLELACDGPGVATADLAVPRSPPSDLTCRGCGRLGVDADRSRELHGTQ